MHTVFRIGEIKQTEDNDRVWEVELKLANDNDPQLHVLTERIRWETKGSIGWDRLGLLLIRLQQFDKATEVYQLLLHAASNESYQAFSYNQLGIIKTHEGDYGEAISFHEKSLQINQKLLPQDHPILTTINNNIGSIYITIGEYQKALLFFEKAKHIWEEILRPNHPDLAISYNNIASPYDKIGKYSEALPFYEKVMDIWQKTLPPNHPD
ncbi:unnamed protein product [Rotaria sp. Silwood2]|nr:unnamed protein product [Rotaria sp. Silwood2]CAF4552002.1 unnamed protein product [Rotaria sp. Silwood2]